MLSEQITCFNCQHAGIPRDAANCPGCGLHFASAPPLAGGRVLGGRYQVDYTLGQGGFGITYRAIHTEFNHPVAIKEFFPQGQVIRNISNGSVTTTKDGGVDYQRRLQRFLNEGRMLVGFRHPGVVEVKDLFQDHGTAYLVMELVEGGTLRQEMDAGGGRLPMPRTREVMEQLAEALEAAHKQGIHHLDIKPDNVMIRNDGRVVLIDFGTARQGVSRTSTQGFSEAYAPLEVIAGKDVGPGSDIYELGVMLHEMLLGTRPPTALERITDTGWSPPPLELPWKGLLAQALGLKLQDRPENVRAWWRGSEVPQPQLQEPVRQTPERLRSQQQPHRDTPQNTPGKTLTQRRLSRTVEANQARTQNTPEKALSQRRQPQPEAYYPKQAGTLIDGPPQSVPWWKHPVTLFVAIGAVAVIGAKSVVGFGDHTPQYEIPDHEPPPEFEPKPSPDEADRKPSEPKCKDFQLFKDGKCVIDPKLTKGMVRVEAGKFWRGSSKNEDEKPEKEIHLYEFWIDTYEVTVDAYRTCVDEGKCTVPSTTSVFCSGSSAEWNNWLHSDRGNHPINCVDWNQAVAYCKWKGKRLSTEAEWEKAARGTDKRVYPWGNEKATCEYAVMDDNGNGCGKDRTWPVGSKPRGVSPYGAHDMAGNVWEWTADWYNSTYYATAPDTNPAGPSSGGGRAERGDPPWSGEGRVERGGGFVSGTNDVRAASRYKLSPDKAGSVIGLRCVRSFH